MSSRPYENLLPPNRYLNSNIRFDINHAKRSSLCENDYELILTLSYEDSDGEKIIQKYSMNATMLSEFSKQLDSAISVIPKCRMYR